MTPRTDVPLGYYLLLLVPPAWMFLAVIAKNPVGIPHAERLVYAALVVWTLLCVLAWLGLQLGLSARPLFFVLFGLGMVLAIGDGLAAWLGLLGALIAVLTFGVCMFLVLERLEDSVIPSVLVVGLAFGVVAGPLIDLYDFLTTRGESVVAVAEEMHVQVEDSRDVFLVVLDGHPGLLTLQLDYQPEVAASFEERLRGAGFDLPASAWSSYRATNLSIPSLLNMNYPAEPGTLSASTVEDLYRIISGENQVTGLLTNSGYETYMVESGWSGSSCRSYDECEASPLLDEPFFIATSQSILGDRILKKFGYSFTVGSRRSMEWLYERTPRISRDSTPTFVFAHILAPHPPFFLNDSCEVVVSSERSGVSFTRAGVSDEDRRHFLLEQMACIETFLVRLAERLSDDAVLVVVSDHGTDSRGQLITSPDDWNDDAVVERMNVLLAVKGLDWCPVPDYIIIPNVMRHVLSCLSEDEIQPLSRRMFLGGGVELAEDRLEALLVGG